MGLLSFLPWSKNETSDVLGMIESGVDKMCYTEEEKADQRQKARETYNELQRIIAMQSTVMAETRRELARSFANLFSFLIVCSALFSAFGMQAQADHFFELAAKVFVLVAMFTTFYVGPDAISAGVKLAANFARKKK